MALIYRNARIGEADQPAADQVLALQLDLRRLGYLRSGIDGVFGNETRLAIRRLQYDFLQNNGASTAQDGTAAIAMNSFNAGVTEVNGVATAAFVDSIEAALADPNLSQIPRSNDPRTDNQAAISVILSTPSTVAPTPFLLAIFQQESNGRHYNIPAPNGADRFVVIGLDYSPEEPDHITSRGYGIGQYTIFHHPPRPEEISDFILDPVRNVEKAASTLREKFDHAVTGATPDTQADDRVAEHPLLTRRVCRYNVNDTRYMKVCQSCAATARKVDIAPSTPLYDGARQTYGDATKYQQQSYRAIPDRASFLCDWPYAVRRYNGGGPNSFHYQARVLRNLLTEPPATTGAVA